MSIIECDEKSTKDIKTYCVLKGFPKKDFIKLVLSQKIDLKEFNEIVKSAREI